MALSSLELQLKPPALCSASEEPMAQPLCTLLLLLAALAGAQAWSPEEEDRVISGGIHDADLNDDEVQHALHFAISEYNKATEDEYYRRPLRVLRAREQVGAATAREVLSSSLPQIFEGELPCPGLFPLAPLSAGLDAGGGRNWGKRVATPCPAPLGLRRPCTGCSSRGCAGTETLQAGKQLCSFQIYEVPWEDRMSLTGFLQFLYEASLFCWCGDQRSTWELTQPQQGCHGSCCHFRRPELQNRKRAARGWEPRAAAAAAPGVNQGFGLKKVQQRPGGRELGRFESGPHPVSGVGGAHTLIQASVGREGLTAEQRVPRNGGQGRSLPCMEILMVLFLVKGLS
ncbi:PREDICTED: uncharacterized protein LOC105582389 [Cercocebus atys]|uniref:uncharacterized protein LOC105582389 n=1 Tax=Cercocebus atys TaxID=9531 RepID=UPI0005F46A08|nr:PREDICTED: uncharacterized protein LOC105582389 [Cercocebus atys]